jgi:Uma2 family endonuclease
VWNRRDLIDLRQVIRHAPDLCVEVLSAWTTKRERGATMQTFARFGEREYWIADPSASAIETDGLSDANYLPRPRAIPPTSSRRQSFQVWPYACERYVKA